MSEAAMNKRPFITVVDLEATGAEGPDHAPIEIGRADLCASAVDLLGQPTEWSVSRPLSVLLSPGRAIPPEASAIHHLVDEDLAGAPPWRETFAEITVDRARCRAFAAHTARTEQQWLTPEIIGDVPWVCTWKCALRAWPDAPAHSNQALRYWLKPEGLDRGLAYPAHRAGPDAYVTAFLLRELLKLHPLPALIQWSGEPAILIRVPFGRTTRGMRWTEVDDDFLYWVLDRDFSTDVHFTVKVELERRRKAAEAAALEEDDA
jgi:exodeoxyribonuclease X